MNELNLILENAGSYSMLSQEQQLATISENTALAVLIFDAQAHLSFANPAGRKLFNNGELKLGQRLLADLGYESFQQLLDKARHSQASLTGEVVWSDKRIFSAEISPVQADSLAVTLYDVSRFKELEKLEKEFVAGVVHDLRNPITSIIGFSHLIKQVGPLTDTQQEFVQHIQNAAANMKGLVENMLNLTKMDLGAESRHDTLDLTAVLWEIADEFQPQAEAKRQLLTIGDTAPNSIVQGDALQLRQALRNLIGNALKYTPDGGTITVSLQQEADMVQIKTKDTGYGMPASELPHIFDRFYRVRNNGHDDVEGNGLGLAIVKSIIEQHQGTIAVQSEPGKGSCFTISLPCSFTEELPTAVLKQEQETAQV